MVAPAEEATYKIWRLLCLGVSLQLLILAVKLPSSAPWTEDAIEQIHGSTALMRRDHKRYSRHTLQSPTMDHAAGPLLPHHRGGDLRGTQAHRGHTPPVLAPSAPS